MTKPHQEELLQKLYGESKKSMKQPNEVTSHVLNYARKKANPLAFLMNWQTIAAAFILGIVLLESGDNSTPTYYVTTGVNLDNQKVYYHDVAYEEVGQIPPPPKKRYIAKQDPQYSAYLESLAKLDNATQLSGVIKQSGDSVVVEICQLGLVQLSPNILSQLNKPDVLQQLRVGQAVTLTTNKQGMLVAIQTPTTGNLEQCAS